MLWSVTRSSSFARSIRPCICQCCGEQPKAERKRRKNCRRDPDLATAECRAPYAHLSEKEQHYWGMISVIDNEIGRLRQALQELGIADNTLLLFTSDNGARSFSRPHQPFSEGKDSLSESGLMVPGIIEWPARIRQAGVCDLPVNLIDLFPTVVDIAGAPGPETFGPINGVSLLPLIDGEWRQRPQPMGFHFLNQRWEQNITRKKDFLTDFGKQGFAVVDNRYKLTTNLLGQSPALYDVVADPGETTDLAATEPAIV